VYPEITRPNAVTAFSGSVLQILHVCEKISKILLPGKGVNLTQGTETKNKEKNKNKNRVAKKKWSKQ